MGNLRSFAICGFVLAVACSCPAVAQMAAPASDDFAATEARENAANAKAGPRVVPGRAIPVPNTVSPELRASIAAPYRVPNWDADPKNSGRVEGADQQAR